MKRPRIKERPLGRERALGQCWKTEGLVEIDPRLKSRLYLGTLIHELLHFYAPDWSESKVDRISREITRELWRRRFRRVEK